MHSALARQVRAQFAEAVGALMESLATDLRQRLLELVDVSTSSRQAQERRDAMLEFERLSGRWLEGVRQGVQAAERSQGQSAPRVHSATGDSAGMELIDDAVLDTKIMASRLAMAIQERVGFEFNDLMLRVQAADGGAAVPVGDMLRPEALSALVVEQWLEAGLARETWLVVANVLHQRFASAVAEALQGINRELLRQGVLPSIDLSQRVRRGRAPDRGRGGAASSPRPEAAAFQESGAPGGAAFPPSDGWAPDAATLSPFMRARARAQGLVGQLRKLLSQGAAGSAAPGGSGSSGTLNQAIGEQAEQFQTQVQSRQAAVAAQGSGFYFDDELVQEVAGDLRARSSELKRQASTASDKAVIEIVALIFQSILAEERIPPSVRVWFARLQMPVLRIALAEPEFFETLQHPARQLIDRMGACVLGFDATNIGGSALEGEIRRVVQLIEQYPDTGRRAFELASTEFQAFLSQYLTGSDATQRVVSVAQQVEQKETMSVRYTIELRRMLEDMPVPDGIREFLFKVWTEVLAVAAVRHGAQHADTQALRQSASDLVWAASAKPSRSERSQVIQQLPRLLQNLRDGMTLTGMEAAQQEAHLKAIGDTLADAFQSKTPAIPRSRIDAIARRLASIEDFVGDDPEGDLPLVAESIEMMLGLDQDGIQVVTDGGAAPNAATQAWARELQPGNWFRLDHNGQVQQVQYAWRSERGQLHLFAVPGGPSVLFQAGRLAGYLQEGLLLPVEDEALTVRATRDALARLDAHPERLLAA